MIIRKKRFFGIIIVLVMFGNFIQYTPTYTTIAAVKSMPGIISSFASGESFSSETKTITYTLSNADKGVYSVDNGPKKAFTDTVDVIIGQGKLADTVITVDITIYSGELSRDYTFTYYKLFEDTVNETDEIVNNISELSMTSESDDATVSSYYSTNPNGGVGVKKTINVDGIISDWKKSMIIAQGAANDDPRVYRYNSMDENPVDLYTLYGAYDNDFLYLMWEMTNVQDIVAPNDEEPLTNGRLYQSESIPFYIAIDTRNSATVIGNKRGGLSEETILNSGIIFKGEIDRLIAVSTDGSQGPCVYGGDSSSISSKEIYDNTTSGIVCKFGPGILSSTIYGINGGYGVNNNRVIGDMCSEDSAWVEFNRKGHNTAKYDYHYEMKIPFSTLGVTVADVNNYGLGIMLIATKGKSGMDCLPYDLSMNDNANIPDTDGSQKKYSYEKNDEDHITARFASVAVSYDEAKINGLRLNFGANLSSPQFSGKSLNLKGIAKGGMAPYTYKFYIDDELIGEKENYGEVDFNWKPTTASTYVIKCEVTDAEGSKVISSKYYTIEESMKVTMLLSATTIYVGESINIKTKVTGGAGEYSYKFMVANDSLTSFVSLAETENNTYTWKGYSEGKRYLVVKVTDENGNQATAMRLVTVKKIDSLVVDVSLSEEKITPKTKVNITATATGGIGAYTYKYQIANEALTSFVTLGTSSKNTYTWTCGNAGKRYLIVTVTDSLGNTAEAKKLLVIEEKKLEVELKLDKSTVAINTIVTMTASATGGKENYTYKYQVANISLTSYVTLGTSSDNTYTWKSISAGQRYLVVTVTDSTGATAVAKELITITTGTTSDLSAELTLSSNTIAVKDSVTMTVIASGGSGSYTYNFQLANTSLTSYVTLGTSSNNTYTWKSISAGKRYLVVTVTDSKGNTVTDKKEIMIL